jgi:hypothetical protein
MQELEKAIAKRAMIGVKSAVLKQKKAAAAGEAEAQAKKALQEVQRSIRDAEKQVCMRGGGGGDGLLQPHLHEACLPASAHVPAYGGCMSHRCQLHAAQHRIRDEAAASRWCLPPAAVTRLTQPLLQVHLAPASVFASR